MISQLVSTLLMALGVATGNISSNAYKGGNAFNKEYEISNEYTDKKPTKKALETTTLVWQRVNDTIGPANQHNYIYYLESSLTNDTMLGNFYASSYCSQQWVYNGQAESICRTYVNITPYYSTDNNQFTLDFNYSLYESNNDRQYITYEVSARLTTQNLDEYIGKTYSNEFDNNNNPTIDNNLIIDSYYDQQIIYQYPNQDRNIQFTLTARNISNSTWVYVYLYAKNTSYNATATNENNIYPNQITWSGNVITPNYEIVDIPGLMYTILTMPFSFISTAFNLTVFPNTPYALNFGNLFLTIITVFILLWLIKKVLK